MRYSDKSNRLLIAMIVFFICFGLSGANAAGKSGSFPQGVRVEFLKSGESEFMQLPALNSNNTENTRITVYGTDLYRVVLNETDRGEYIEINGELESLSGTDECGTLRISFPLHGNVRKWFRGLDRSEVMNSGILYTDTVSVVTQLPPDGAFNGRELAEGGYGDAVGQGTMSFWPLCAVSTDDTGTGLGIDMSLPVVYRLGADDKHGLMAEFDFATSPLAKKFPNRAFFRLCEFSFDPEWGMREALKHYYDIYPEAFRKRVTDEGIWLPFTSLRSIPGWDEFGIRFHETSAGSSDKKDGARIPNITSDKGTGVMSFQYTEPWDIQLPISTKNIPYDTVISQKRISNEHYAYLSTSATLDKNGLWQARRLETPWFKTGWAVSITTNCDPDLPGFNRYQYILDHEINPSLKLNVDGIYFDSMEWNWHHDLNYREEHFAVTDYPLTFSKSVGKPAIWNFVSEFEFMKKISDQMHTQGKLAMGNGHGWNPFAASNLDLFGAELSLYSSDAHNVGALDFKRAISFRKPIVFLLNEGLNDKVFTEAPYSGYEIYFEKMMAYGFFPSFFSVDASNDPYWQDLKKIETGRPFFKKYIPLIRQIAGAGWEPVTYATANSENVRVERFGNGGEFFFTVRNNGNEDAACTVTVNLQKLGITGKISASEIVKGLPVKVKGNNFNVNVPAGRTRVIKIESL